MNETIIVAFIGVFGVVLSSLLTHIIATKEYRLKVQEHNSTDMIELISKYKIMCDDLEKKIENLEKKVTKLEQENSNLKSVMASHGITVITTEVTS